MAPRNGPLNLELDGTAQAASGGETWRCRTASGRHGPKACPSPGGHGPKACPLLPFQTMGRPSTPDQLREGSGDPFSARESSCPQEAASGSGEQGAAAAGSASEAQRAGPQVDHCARQAAGAACGPA
eukprot:1378640-Amphidinium_carterae.1